MGMLALCLGEIWRGPIKIKGKLLGQKYTFPKFRHTKTETNAGYLVRDDRETDNIL